MAGSTTTTSSATEGWPALRERASSGRRSARPRCAHHGRRGAQPRPRVRHDAPGRDPRQLRAAARARRRQRDAADRDPAPPDRRLAASRRRLPCSQLGRHPGRPDRAATSRPPAIGRRPRTINMSHHRRCAARRRIAPQFGPRIECRCRLQQQSGGDRAGVGARRARLRGEDLFTVVLEHFLTDTADHADIVLPATTQLEHLDVHGSYGHTRCCSTSRRSHRSARRAEHADLSATWPCAWAFATPALPTTTRRSVRQAFGDAVVRRAARAGLVVAAAPRGTVRRGRFPTRKRARMIDAPGLGVPDFVPNHESVQSAPRDRAALPAGDDLAAGATS